MAVELPSQAVLLMKMKQLSNHRVAILVKKNGLEYFH